ncbi:hypothetical protein CPB84DRAFT_202587 [Gymnopilus junonius]|uniref:Uncharacterized protein n=1 Tax=Gymnopilus junonius TaxID=109634 RepID=A0A9P5NXV7_GYMJU|nr:hypothetical protein CPB84DRAFT_202587 [Gymnopilus junonius]
MAKFHQSLFIEVLVQIIGLCCGTWFLFPRSLWQAQFSPGLDFNERLFCVSSLQTVCFIPLFRIRDRDVVGILLQPSWVLERTLFILHFSGRFGKCTFRQTCTLTAFMSR